MSSVPAARVERFRRPHFTGSWFLGRQCHAQKQQQQQCCGWYYSLMMPEDLQKKKYFERGANGGISAAHGALPLGSWRVFKNPKRFRSALTRGSNPRQCRRTGSSEACNAIRRQAVAVGGSAELLGSTGIGLGGLGVWS